MPVLCGYRLNLTYERSTGKPEVIRTSEKSAYRQVRSIGNLALAKLLTTPVFYALRDSSLRCYGQVNLREEAIARSPQKSWPRSLMVSKVTGCK